ncbi:hypothetical protein PFICI_14907 [Pestalotiopsis fici W106-1]|uniref:Zn(2)-C6 fungal-type domain-containing protein n=1 Tax=Pestalotiopsis fici (strain W106-1 / CGMCC3.15140) TaxID=1229662 RepID=W3WJJ7_PESFW|nr:uncharacterized protein PFICI_14907 [Pestalotiopsis fici W106-1]ETS73302.1 hypothetical protein PFICI_14907 [Pestalotiopsis fici W106-1]
MSNPPTPVLRRLNGRLQACDPCRSRKVACDHGRPVCLRCRKRQQDRHCVYTVSSTTVGLGIGTSRSPSVSAPARAAQRRDDNVVPTLSPGARRTSVVTSPASTRASSSRAIGYLGYTSYSTVIDETLCILNDIRAENPQSPCMDDCPIAISSKTIALGVTVLRHIPFPEDGQRLFRRELTVKDSWMRLVARHILETLYDEWGGHLGRVRSVSKLEEMARRICVNTAKPIVNRGDGVEWLEQFRGPNLRWESLGVLFHGWDLVDDAHKIKMQGASVYIKQSAPSVQEFISLCLELCQEFSDGNFFTVYLDFKRTLLESLISGDASRQTCRYLADTVASLTFLGMHAEPTDEFYQPTFYAEASRRVLLAVFTVDKVQLAFTGRPPLLFRKFVTTPMPLDISDQDLFLDQASLLKKIQNSVDDKGWNTNGEFFSSTIVRARYMVAQIREHIAEIALGNDSQTTADELHRIKQKQDAVVAEFPPSLHWQAEDMADPEVDANIVFNRLLLSLDSLQNDFFVYRLLVRTGQGQPDEGCLLATSFRMVSLVLLLWTNMDRFQVMRPDFGWLLMGYGASPGGILCKCLLKAQSSQIHPGEPEITRSAIIQKLSLLVGFLDWVSPTAPNAELCKDCKSVIERVLDQALNCIPGNAPAFGASINWDLSTPLDFNFDLMDTYDWLRSD